MVTWLDSLSLTSAPLNRRLRYRALCDMRTKMHQQYWATRQDGPDSTRSVPWAALRRALEQLDWMHRHADKYLRSR